MAYYEPSRARRQHDARAIAGSRQDDDAFLATSEHLDLSLDVRRRGGDIFFEPAAVVTYHAPPPVRLRDPSFYMLRWCDEWARGSERHFHEKWT